MRKEYWKASLEELCGELNIPYSEALLEGILGISECESLGCGYDAIHSPSISEVDVLKKKIKDIKAAHQNQLDGIVNNYCESNKRDPDSVYIEGDTLMFKHDWLR